MKKPLEKKIFITWCLCVFLVIILNRFVSPQIQSILIISLIFITLYYAIQTRALVDRTHELVEQEKINRSETIKKRYIDFLERRINEFYVPFSKKSHHALNELTAKDPNSKIIDRLRNEMFYLYRGKSHLILKNIIEKIDKLDMLFFIAEIDRDKDSFKKYIEAQKEVQKIIRKDWDETIDIIRNSYGIETEEKGIERIEKRTKS